MLSSNTALRLAVSELHTTPTKILANAKSQWLERRGLLVQVIRADGSCGWGEASPLPDYSPDTLEQCREYLKGLQLFGEQELGLVKIQEFVARIPEELPAARFAIECALLDLLAQERNESVAVTIGGGTNSAERCALIDLDDPLRSVDSLLARGVSCGKLKVGCRFAGELDTILALRKHLPSFGLRLDVNGVWSVEQALQNLQSLAGLDIEFVEQPVAPAKMSQLVGCPVPLAADESMRSSLGRAALAPLIESKDLVAIVLKPTILGGLVACKKYKRWAQAQGVASIASHCFEGVVGTAAVAELAVATRGAYAAGVNCHDALAPQNAAQITQLAESGIRSHSPGLGIALPR